MSRASIGEFLVQLSQRVAAGQPVCVATVVRVHGSASARPGSKAIFDEQGRRVFGWVGGGCAETTIARQAQAVLQERRPRLLRLDLDDEVLGVGMPCGGFMEIFIEPIRSPSRLLVLGHGRIAETLVKLGRLLDFHVTVNDPLATAASFPEADVRCEEDADYAKVECDRNTFVVVTTQHRSDYEALSQVLRQGPAYVGVVASQKRSALLLERLGEDGFPPEVLRTIFAPGGLDLAAATPEEIAFAIMAEVLQCLHRDEGPTGRPLAELKGARRSDPDVAIPAGADPAERKRR